MCVCVREREREGVPKEYLNYLPKFQLPDHQVSETWVESFWLWFCPTSRIEYVHVLAYVTLLEFFFLLARHCGAGWLFSIKFNQKRRYKVLFYRIFPHIFFYLQIASSVFFHVTRILVIAIKIHIKSKILYIWVKWSNPGKGVAPSPRPRCSSYWKGSLRVTHDQCPRLYIKKSVIL